MMSQPPTPSFWDRLPSFVWILLIVGGIIAFIGGIIGTFYLLSHVEGVGSLIMLIVAWAALRAGSSDKPTPPEQSGGLFTAIGLTFFAMMGLAIDQTGNPIYNQPLEWFFCPGESQLQRGVDVSHPRAGTTTITQEFACMDGEREVKRLGMGAVIGVRFVEYVLIGYLLIGLNRLYNRVRPATG